MSNMSRNALHWVSVVDLTRSHQHASAAGALVVQRWVVDLLNQLLDNLVVFLAESSVSNLNLSVGIHAPWSKRAYL